jgi:SAM-dependent methyltransferase
VSGTERAPLPVALARRLMGLFPLEPDPRTTSFYVASLGKEGLPPDAVERLLAESQNTYDDEKELPFLDLYYRYPVRGLLAGKTLLDIGCSVGGRSVRLAETLGVPRVYGLDILPEDIEVANRFAASRGVPGDFRAGRGEEMPFESDSIGNIVTYDAFEHVADVEAVLRECRRILEPGGHLVAVFPPFGNPFESHLLFSQLPAIHWLFSGRTLARAQRELGDSKGWPSGILSDALEPWERMPTLNGITRRSFREAVQRTGWEVVYERYCPLFTTGRRSQRNPIFRGLRRLLSPLTGVPGVREYATDRVATILRKPAGSRV